MRRRKKIISDILITAIIAVLVTAAVCSVGLLLMRKDRVEQGRQNDQLAAELAAMAQALEEALTERNALEAEKTALESELAEARNALGAADSEAYGRYQALQAEYALLQEQLKSAEKSYQEKNDAYEALSQQFDAIEEVYSVNLNRQLELMEQLNMLLTDGRPLVYDKIAVTDEEGLPVLDENGEPTYRYEGRPCRVSLYYEDLKHGYTYSHGAEESYPSASLVKAPYALAILQQAREEWCSMMAATETTDETADAASGDVLLPDTPNPMSVMGLDELYVYTAADKQYGSGVIIEGEEGTAYTYYELIAYLLNESDNVAYVQLRKKYGFEALNGMIGDLKLSSMYGGISQVSAADCGRIMKAMYAFMEVEDPYSSLLYDNLVKTNYQVMIPYGVHPTPAPHKYGWDTGAYHDMAVVYDEHPYVVAILSDLDEGDEEVRKYVQTVIGVVNALHQNFYQ